MDIKDKNLTEASSDDPVVRSRAVHELVMHLLLTRTDLPVTYVKVLVRLLHDPHSSVRTEAAEALGFSDHRDAAEALLSADDQGFLLDENKRRFLRAVFLSLNQLSDKFPDLQSRIRNRLAELKPSELFRFPSQRGNGMMSTAKR